MFTLPPLIPTLPPLVLSPRDLTPTAWFPVCIDGWVPPAHDGWYEWRRIDDGGIDRLWYNAKTTHVMAVCGHCPPLVWNAWRGVVGAPV